MADFALMRRLSVNGYEDSSPEPPKRARQGTSKSTASTASKKKKKGKTKWKVGERCRVECYPNTIGTVRYFGETWNEAHEGVIVVGVAFDKAMGSHDGTTSDGQYFECPAGHGIVTKPDRLVDAFPVGSRVTVQGYEGAAGTVRYCGKHLAKKKTVTGVELDQPIGKNNGSTADGTYFECADRHGVLVADAAKLSVAFDIGATVAVDGYEGAIGTVRYHGPHKKKKAKIVFGVELDTPSGKNNGSTDDGTYFECPDRHGILVSNQEKLQAMVADDDAAGTAVADDDAAVAVEAEESLGADDDNAVIEVPAAEED